MDFLDHFDVADASDVKIQLRLAASEQPASSPVEPAPKRARRGAGARTAEGAAAPDGAVLRMIHAHRLMLLKASEFFKTRLRPEWSKVRRMRAHGRGRAAVRAQPGALFEIADSPPRGCRRAHPLAPSVC